MTMFRHQAASARKRRPRQAPAPIKPYNPAIELRRDEYLALLGRIDAERREVYNYECMGDFCNHPGGL